MRGVCGICVEFSGIILSFAESLRDMCGARGGDIILLGERVACVRIARGDIILRAECVEYVRIVQKVRGELGYLKLQIVELIQGSRKEIIRIGWEILKGNSRAHFRKRP